MASTENFMEDIQKCRFMNIFARIAGRFWNFCNQWARAKPAKIVQFAAARSWSKKFRPLISDGKVITVIRRAFVAAAVNDPLHAYPGVVVVDMSNEFQVATNELNKIKNVVAIASGKGGVGKSLVTSLLAVALRRRGYRVGIMDADITGPSIPKIFGIQSKIEMSELGIFPPKSASGIEIISINLLLEQEDAPVIWRGPIISGTVKQFWSDVIWGDLDYLLLDMPPGTGDVPLTIFQSIPVKGLIVVTSPQDLVGLIVKKAYHMAKEMKIPVLGLIENMSYLHCPDCGKRIELFGASKADKMAGALGIELLAQLPVNPELAQASDRGEIEKTNPNDLTGVVTVLEQL